ncbi:elongation factor P, partial [Xylella fastidiosa subsp. multiplex]|nr:elongation factor P [Xylella fastidiosa subsp. multiplex]
MASYGMNDVKHGMKSLVDAEPEAITDTEHVKPGKGQAFPRFKYRLLKLGRVQAVTMQSTETLEEADV